MLFEHSLCSLISEMGYHRCIALSCVNTTDLPQGPYGIWTLFPRAVLFLVCLWTETAGCCTLSTDRLGKQSLHLKITANTSRWKISHVVSSPSSAAWKQNSSMFCFWFPPLFSKYLAGLSFYKSKILLLLDLVKVQQVPKIRCPVVQFCTVISLLAVTSLVC